MLPNKKIKNYEEIIKDLDKDLLINNKWNTWEWKKEDYDIEYDKDILIGSTKDANPYKPKNDQEIVVLEIIKEHYKRENWEVSKAAIIIVKRTECTSYEEAMALVRTWR